MQHMRNSTRTSVYARQIPHRKYFIICSPKSSFEGFVMQNYSLPVGTCSGVIPGNLDEGVTHAWLVVSQVGCWDATDHVVSV